MVFNLTTEEYKNLIDRVNQCRGSLSDGKHYVELESINTIEGPQAQPEISIRVVHSRCLSCHCSGEELVSNFVKGEQRGKN